MSRSESLKPFNVEEAARHLWEKERAAKEERANRVQENTASILSPEAEMQFEDHRGKGLSPHEATRLKNLLLERASRKLDALSLYQPMPVQDAFHKSMARERVIRGANRSGKTVSAAVEVARALTGRDPQRRYPNEGGIAYCVGKDGRHLGHTMFKKLFRAGAFKIIRSEHTGQFRVWNPNNPADLLRRAEAKKAPPLIPNRFIQPGGVSWENKKEGIPRLVKLKNGWEIYFFSSNALPPQGSDIDLAWFDEEIPGQMWYPEIAARLVDRSGWFLWSATPQAGTEQLYALHERSEKEAEMGVFPRKIEEFVVTMDENQYLTTEQKDDLISRLTDEERRVRVDGEFALLTFRIFPEFKKAVHGVEFFEIPKTWTRYAAIDPGRQICAVLFMAIPPPEVGDFAYIYDELYIPNCDANLFGKKMAEKCEGQSMRKFIIDNHEARKIEAGSGRSIKEQYSDALRERGVSSEVTGNSFEDGSDDPVAGVEAIRLWLLSRDDKPPKIRVFTDKCGNFLNEVKFYRYKRVAGVLTDRPEDRGPVHLMACWRYLVQSRPIYVEPRKAKAKENPVWRAAQEWKKSHEKKQMNFGPAGAGA